MADRTTSDLTRDLMNQSNIDLYLRNNIASFAEQSVAEQLTELYEKKSISKAELARRAGISEVYLHQVFSGRRNPSRDRLLCICIGLGATLDEIQALLKRVSYAQIYPKIKRDTIISFGVVHHMDLNAINDKLFAENEKTLF